MVHGSQVNGPTGPVFSQSFVSPSALPNALDLKGVPGSPSATSLDGFHGTCGPPGPPGPPGSSGPPGPPGPPGTAGPRGDTGDRGQRGERGDRGQRGDPGESGERGSQGARGPVGPSGPVGPAGPTGTVDVAILNLKLVLMEARLAALESKCASQERDRDRIDRFGLLRQPISNLVDELGIFRIGLHVGGTWNQDLHHRLGVLQSKMSAITDKM